MKHTEQVDLLKELVQLLYNLVPPGAIQGNTLGPGTGMRMGLEDITSIVAEQL